jgi:hypothetical protein
LIANPAARMLFTDSAPAPFLVMSLLVG